MKRSTDRSGLNYWSEKESRLEAAHLLDQVDAALNEESNQVTPFLSMAMRDWLEAMLRKEHLSYVTEGGFPDPERVRILFGLQEEHLNPKDAEIVLLWVVAADPRAQLEHRQILGSLMGLGLRRELIGDIQAGEHGFYVAIVKELIPFLLREWTQAGREKIKVSQENEQPNFRSAPGENRRITVNSSRLDAVLANGFGVSRSLAQEWITQGRVKRNDRVISKAEVEVATGDIISCRGQGRIKLIASEQTRKERIAWQIELFRSQKH